MAAHIWFQLTTHLSTQKDERLSWPSWLTCNGRFMRISGHPSAAGWAQDRESSPVRDRRSTIVPRYQPTSRLVWAKKKAPCTRWECTLAPPGEYDCTICAHWQCGRSLTSNYSHHLVLWALFLELLQVGLNSQNGIFVCNWNCYL